MEDYIKIQDFKLENQDENDQELFLEAFEEFEFDDFSEDSSIITVDSKFKPEKLSGVSFEDKYVVFKGEKVESFSETKGNEEESENYDRISKNPDEVKFNLSPESDKETENQEKEVNSAISCDNNDKVLDFVSDDIWSLRERETYDDGNSSFLTVLAGLIMSAIGYQFNLWISFFKFPIWLSSVSFMFVMDPFSVMNQGKEYLTDNAMRNWNSVFGNSSMYEWFREPRSVVELGLKLMWGLLWSVYVGVVLTAMLVSAFIVGGILMRVIVEEPVKMKEKLDFDYTGRSPVVFVPIIGCSEVCYGTDCSQKLEVAKLGGGRVIPPGHKLQVSVSLTLPESDYNRNLGIFQVRVDYLAADGKVLASSRHPSMLQFRSEPIRLLLTFLKAPPILYGLASETQVINIKFKGVTEAAATPTSCLRVTIEQRAEFQPGAGIPEIHSASLTLESEQPGLKRIVWCWRNTLFVWISMTIFTTELLFVLLCCSPVLMPRGKLGGNSARNVDSLSRL